MKRLVTAMLVVASMAGLLTANNVVTASPAQAASDDYLRYPAENQKVIDRWNQLGRDSGPLGSPLTHLECESGGVSCFEEFMGGYLYANRDQTTAKVIYKYSGNSGPKWYQIGRQFSGLGPATSDETVTSTGSYQSFRQGRITSSSSAGTRVVRGGIYGAYSNMGFEQGKAGYPLVDQTCVTGGCHQKFQGGTIYQAYGAHFVPNVVGTKYESLGGYSGTLGWPMTGYTCLSDGSCVQQFQNGYITVAGAAVNHYLASFTKECNSLNNNMVKFSGKDANRVSFAIAESYGSYNATFYNCKKAHGIYIHEWTAPATVGSRGFVPPGVASGPTRYEYSPTGSYSVTEAFGLANPGTALRYQTLNPGSRWGGNPYTWNYNKYFEGPSYGYDEDMWYLATRPQRDYAQGAVINYNRPPDSEIVQDAGFAIFLHGNRVPTAGCIALDDGPLHDWLRTAIPGDRIIMGVRSDVFYP